MFFYTITNRTFGVHLATALSQDGVNVFHIADEMKIRHQSTSQNIFTGDESEYWVHTPCPGSECCIHVDCVRTPLSKFIPENKKKEIVSSSLYNIARIYNEMEKNVIQKILLSPTNQLGVGHHHTLKEFGESTGWCHSHGLGWRKSMNDDIIEIHRKMVKLNKPLTKEELCRFADFCDSVVTASLCSERIVQNFPDISLERSTLLTLTAATVNIHKPCIPAKCHKTADICHYGYPQLPSSRTLITRKPTLDNPKEIADLLGKAEAVREMVREAIENVDDLEAVTMIQMLRVALGTVEVELHEDMQRTFTVNGVAFVEDEALREEMFNSPYGPDDDDDVIHGIYMYCLMWNREHRLVLQREVREAYVVQYEPHILEATGANHSMEIITRTPFKVYDYITKKRYGANEDAEKIRQDMESLGYLFNKERLMGQTAAHREVTQSEAYFRVDHSLVLSRSNINVVFVNTNFPDLRVRRYQKDRTHIKERRREPCDETDEEVGIEEEEDIPAEDENWAAGVTIEGKDGLFYSKGKDMLEKYSMIPDILKLLLLAQFAVNYILANPDQSTRLKKKYQSQEQIPDSKIKMAISNDDLDDGKISFLPEKILLRDGTFMVKRKKPAVLQTPRLTSQHKKEYSDLLLYTPWSSEERDLGPALENMEVCSEMHARMDRRQEIGQDGKTLTKIQTVMQRMNTARNTVWSE